MLKLFIADLKMAMRNRQSLFWALAFPLLFTVIFGFFFGKNTSVGTIGMINNSNTPVATTLVKAVSDSGLFKVDATVTTADQGRDLIKQGKIAAVVVIPANFGAMTPNAPVDVSIIDDPANAQANATLSGFIGQFMTQLTLQANQVKGPIFGVTEEKTNTRELSYFDFVLSGILGLALMNSSIIGVSVGMSKYREDKIMKRLTTTPMKSWWFIVSEVASRLVINIVQISLILTIGIYFFHGHIYGSIPALYGLALLGGILFQLIGFVIASFVKTTDAAQGAATAITIPMMFLGGVFFPIDSLPKWLFSIVQYLPIAPLLRIIRGLALEGNSVFFNPANIAIVLLWIAVCLVISIWKFRLSEE